jgi:D-sedoheptulose 7-phosphate isomerase
MNDLAKMVEDGYARREIIAREFFQDHAQSLAQLCHLMAQRFIRGGRLIAFGVGPAATDAQHVSVEFVHPVIVGKRALPALALPNDAATNVGLAVEDPTGFIARELAALGRPQDMALGMLHGPSDAGGEAVKLALKHAASAGMLTIGLGGPGVVGDLAEHVYEVADQDPYIVQEIHETLYHVLWELVHVFFDHKGLLADRPKGPAHDSGRSSFLYPFLAEAEVELEPVVRQTRDSILQKVADVIEMRESSKDAEGLAETARLMAAHIDAGATVLAFGNGGSATDAQDLVVDLMAPAAGIRRIPAISLTNDAGVVTAVGNDVGFDNVFARQVIAYGRKGDIAFPISTSGGSRNVLAAIEEARSRGLLTVGLGGYGGGKLAQVCDRSHCIAADYIPRIQEAQATQYHILCRLLGTLAG